MTWGIAFRVRQYLRMVGTAPSPQGALSAGALTNGVVMPIREYGAGSIQVVRRLRELLAELAEIVVP
jgi:uncharacterized membrane protein